MRPRAACVPCWRAAPRVLPRRASPSACPGGATGAIIGTTGIGRKRACDGSRDRFAGRARIRRAQTCATIAVRAQPRWLRCVETTCRCAPRYGDGVTSAPGSSRARTPRTSACRPCWRRAGRRCVAPGCPRRRRPSRRAGRRVLARAGHRCAGARAGRRARRPVAPELVGVAPSSPSYRCATRGAHRAGRAGRARGRRRARRTGRRRPTRRRGAAAARHRGRGAGRRRRVRARRAGGRLREGERAAGKERGGERAGQKCPLECVAHLGSLVGERTANRTPSRCLDLCKSPARRKPLIRRPVRCTSGKSCRSRRARASACRRVPHMRKRVAPASPTPAYRRNAYVILALPLPRASLRRLPDPLNDRQNPGCP